MKFDYDLCHVLVQNLKQCNYIWYISVFPEYSHIAGYRYHIAVVFISTSPFGDTQITLPHTWRPLKYGSLSRLDDRGEVDIDSDINYLASGNLRQSTTVTSQCERLPWT